MRGSIPGVWTFQQASEPWHHDGRASTESVDQAKKLIGGAAIWLNYESTMRKKDTALMREAAEVHGGGVLDPVQTPRLTREIEHHKAINRL
jgi:hypothetical protein